MHCRLSVHDFLQNRFIGIDDHHFRPGASYVENRYLTSRLNDHATLTSPGPDLYRDGHQECFIRLHLAKRELDDSSPNIARLKLINRVAGFIDPSIEKVF